MLYNLFSDIRTFLKCFLSAVQNERQPRNSAQVRQDQLEAELENPIAASNTTVSATHPAFTPGHGGHRFISGLIPSETTTKQEADDAGESPFDLSIYILLLRRVRLLQDLRLYYIFNILITL